MKNPVPSSERVSNQMRAQRSHNTGCELELRGILHRMGLRYRVHRRPMRKITREADIVFTSAKVAIFVDGCFWHECPIHGSIPVSNHEWWKTKLDRNKDRDIETNEFLRAAGWVVVRIWEHDDYCLAADMINKIVTQRRLSFSTTPNK